MLEVNRISLSGLEAVSRTRAPLLSSFKLPEPAPCVVHYEQQVPDVILIKRHVTLKSGGNCPRMKIKWPTLRL
jgi:hypothetical protein